MTGSHGKNFILQNKTKKIENFINYALDKSEKENDSIRF